VTAFLTSLIFVVLAEMGDKTQLATISLAVEYQNMLNVLMGTTLGMVIADALGIIVGIVLRKHLPDKVIKWTSAGVFVLFGFIGAYRILSNRFSELCAVCILAVLGVCLFYVTRAILKVAPVATEKIE